tara:strand:- start:1628 stop:2602 length:975 start_codon:yes stop_codon:yes gene_type:complete
MITVEYIWLDGGADMPQLRAKTRVFDKQHTLSELPDWSFDGGSTYQGCVGDSDRTLKPVRLYKNPFSAGNYMVLCEVMNPEGGPHSSNNRAALTKLKPSDDMWFGFEQEYTLTDPMMQPLVPEDIQQGNFYCGVGAGNVIGRLVADEHLDNCYKAGITLFGTNAEVMISQWEYQTNPEQALKACDDLWMSRFIAQKGSEKFNMRVSYHPKIYAKLNGAGCHVNISTSETREDFSTELRNEVMTKLEKSHKQHIKAYGAGNDLRLTGDHETSDIDKFTWGIGDRSVSVRIPAHVEKEGKGYFEDRRPAATCDPYLVTACITKTLK